MNFFPPVTPVQVNPLDLAEIQKNNIGNAMGRVGLQNMQDEMSARKAMSEFISQNGGLPQSTDQVNKMALTLASRGLPMDKAFEVAAKAQQFALANQKLGLYQQANSLFQGGGAPSPAPAQGAPISGLPPVGVPQQPTMAGSSDPLASPTQPMQSPIAPATDKSGITMPDNPFSGLKTDIQGASAIPGFITGASTGKLIPEFDKRLNAFAQAYLAATGEPLRMTDSYRGYDAQVDVKNRKGSLAATPGASMHGYGGAVDIDPAQADKAAKLGLLQMFGLDRPLNGRAVNPEPWHVQPAGLNEQGLRATGPSGYKPGSEYSQFLPQMGGGAPGQPQVAGLSTPTPLTQMDVSRFKSALQTSPGAPATQFVRADIVQANPDMFFDPQTRQAKTVQQVAEAVRPGGQAPTQLAQAGPKTMTDASAPPMTGGAQQPPSSLPAMPMAPIQGVPAGGAVNKLRDVVQRNPAILMLPEVDAMVKGALAVDGYRTPEQMEAIKYQFDVQRENVKKQLEVANAGAIAATTEEGKARGALAGEQAGGAPVSPQGVAEAAGMKSGAEASAKVGPAVSQKAIDQIIDEQKGARDQLDQIAQRKARLVKAAESPEGGAGVSFITSIAPILDIIVPEGASGWIAKKNAELQQAGMKGAELQKALAQESANMIAQNVGLHRGGEWALGLAKSANPQAPMTKAQRNLIIADINDQLDMQAKAVQDLLGHSTNTDADMLNKRALDRNLPVLQSHGERIGKALQTATAPIEAKSGGQGKGMTFSSLDSLKTAVSRGDINVNQAREIARANGWAQ